MRRHRPTPLLLAVTLAGPAGAAAVELRQGTTQLGLAPLESAASVVGFYGYDTVHPASADTGLETSETSLLFLYQQSSGSPRPLSLVVIHDRYDDGTGGEIDFAFSGLPAGTFYAVRDDFASPFPGSDRYLPDPPAGGATTASWAWSSCCTDGAVLAGLEGERFCVRVEPRLGSGIVEWQALSGPGLSPQRTALPSLTQPVHLCQDCLELSCPAVINAECGGTSSAFVSVTASGSSLCGGAGISNDRTGGGADASDIYPLGTTRVVFTLSDGPGFSTTCETLVVVEDSEDPTILTCPPPLALPCTGTPVPLGDPIVQAWIAGFTATDTCSAVVLANDAPAQFTPTCGAAPVVVTFSAEDESGNGASCAASVTLEDKDPPTVSSCPAEVVLECDDPAGIPATDPRLASFFAGFAASDDCGPLTLRHDAPARFASGCGAGVRTPVEFEAEDGCGRSATCSSAVTVRDTTPPAVACPAPTTVECRAPGGTPAADPEVQAWRQGASASDACGGASLADDLPALLPAGCTPGSETIATFTATDDCSLTRTCAASIRVADREPPIVRACPPPLALECNAPGGVPASDPQLQAFLAGFTADDVCSAVTLDNDAPALFPAGCAPGTTTPVAFAAEDSCGNPSGCGSSVTVSDATPPIVSTCPAPLVLECDGPGGIPASDPRIQAWLGSFAAADVCGAVTPGNDAPALFPSACGAGQATTVQFTARDGCGNPASCTSTLTVRDTTPPAITLCPAPLALECDGPGGIPASDPRVQAWLLSFAASDACSAATLGHDAPAFLPSGCGGGRATTVTFRASDGCGLAATCTSTVTVRDSMPPAITSCPAPLALECDAPGGIPASDPRLQAWLGSFAAADVCDGATLSHDAPALFPAGCTPGLRTPVRFAAIDNCGNAAACTSSVTVVDSTPPVVTRNGLDGRCLWPPNHKLWCVDDVAAEVGGEDVCDPGAVSVRVRSCQSDQPDDAPEGHSKGADNGDGHTTRDCRIENGGRGLCVRAERLGGDPAGRHYRVVLEVTDGCGNATTTAATIEVPHDQSPGRDCESAHDGK